MLDCDGVRLHAAVDPGERERGGRPVVVLHGFTGDSDSMAGVCDALETGTPNVRVELIGHGRSEAPHDPALYSMERCVAQVAAAIEVLALPRPHLVGYSMGGRVALALAARSPERISSVLTVGASAGLEDPLERARRRQSDEALADRILRDGVPAFVDAWMANPLFASQRRLALQARARARRQRLRNRAHGLANSLIGMGSGAQACVVPLLAQRSPPICLLVGAEDAKFRAIAEKLASAVRLARVETIPSAGHAAHLENPAAFATAMRRFHEEVEAQCVLVRAAVPRS